MEVNPNLNIFFELKFKLDRIFFVKVSVTIFGGFVFGVKVPVGLDGVKIWM